MKLEVGMYVRTKKGNVGKITKITKECIFFDRIMYLGFIKTGIQPKYLYKDKIDTRVIKASHSIKGLIEDNDLVKFKIYGELAVCEVYNKSLVKYDGEVFDLEELDIVSILTKEQFESMSYKVGE